MLKASSGAGSRSPSQSSSPLAHLRTLRLDSNRLEALEPGALEVLAAAPLTTLDLAHNRLPDLPAAAFAHLPQLEILCVPIRTFAISIRISDLH